MAEVVIDIVGKDSFSGVLGNFGSIMTGIESAINLAGRALTFFKDQALAGLDAIASWERLTATFETLVAKEIMLSGATDDMNQALAMSAEKAQELLEWNQRLAINSPFTTEGVAQAFRMALAYGFTTDEAKRLTEALIDFSAGSGATEYSMQAIARALGQISATGKVTGGDMLQLVNAGLPVVEILAEGFGVTTEKLMEMRSDGLLPATEAIEYITAYLEKNFAGAAERQATTWAGLQGTFEDLKQMGLREFFGGMFEVLQPLAIELSNFLQTEGLDKLKEWGTTLGEITTVVIAFGQAVADGNLYDLGSALQEVAGTDSIFYAIGTALRVFQNDIDNGATTWNAFITFLERFDSLSDMDVSWLREIAEAGANLIDAIADAGVMSMESREAFGLLVQTIDEKLAEAINEHDWEASGVSFGEAIGTLLTSGDSTINPSTAGTFWERLLENFTNTAMMLPGINILVRLLQSQTVAALWQALNEFLSGALSGLENWTIVAEQNINTWWATLGTRISGFFSSFFNVEAIQTAWTDMWNGLVAGLTLALDFEDVKNTIDTFVTRFINYVKTLFGISSPSTVFYDIGKNIVQGLINGILGMFPSLTSVVSNMFDLLTGGRTGGATGDATGLLGGSTGTIGGRNMGDLTTTSGLTAASVINNFYGPVYFGDLGQLGYDCPSPHPLLTASAAGIGGM